MINDIHLFHIIYSFTIFVIMNIMFIMNFSNDKIFKYIFCIFSIFIISIIVSIRGPGVGLDTNSYMNFYKDPINSTINNIVFVLLAILSKNIYDNHILFFFLVSFVTNYYYFKTFYKIDKRYFCIYFAIFLSFFLFINTNINIIRQGLSMSFFSYGVVLMYIKQKNAHAFVYFLLAMLTHSSAIIVVFGFLVFNAMSHHLSKKHTEKLLFCLIIATFFITLSFFIKQLMPLHPIFNIAYSYLSWNIGKELTLKYFYVLIIIMLLFYSYQINFKHNKNLHGNIQYYLLILFALCIILFFREEEMFADRLFYYFFAFLPLLIYSIKNFFIERKTIVLLIFVGINMWFFKSYILQYIGWYITKESIRM